MIFSLVAMTGLEKCCITSACLQWLCHSGERPVARGPLVILPVNSRMGQQGKGREDQWQSAAIVAAAAGYYSAIIGAKQGEWINYWSIFWMFDKTIVAVDHEIVSRRTVVSYWSGSLLFTTHPADFRHLAGIKMDVQILTLCMLGNFACFFVVCGFC